MSEPIIKGEKKIVFDPSEGKFMILGGKWLFLFGKEFRADSAKLFGLILKSEYPRTEREKKLGQRLLDPKKVELVIFEIEDGPTEPALSKALKNLKVKNPDINIIIANKNQKKLKHILDTAKKLE